MERLIRLSSRRSSKELLLESGYIIADLSLNYQWFDFRVREAHLTGRRKKWLSPAEGWVKARILLYDFYAELRTPSPPDSIHPLIHLYLVGDSRKLRQPNFESCPGSLTSDFRMKTIVRSSQEAVPSCDSIPLPTHCSGRTKGTETRPLGQSPDVIRTQSKKMDVWTTSKSVSTWNLPLH